MSQYVDRWVDRVEAAGPAATRAAAVLLPVSGGITVLGAVLLFTVAVLGAAGALLALLSLGCGLLQIVLGTQQLDGEPGVRRATVWCCLGSSLFAVLLLGVGSGATLVAVLLPLVVLALLGAPEAARFLRVATGRRARAVRRAARPGGLRSRP